MTSNIQQLHISNQVTSKH